MIGVDLSNYQSAMNIATLGYSGYSFAILKATEGTTVSDRSFRKFAEIANKNSLPIGAYCFSHATDPERARSEAAFILHAVEGFDLPLGIYMDVETSAQLNLSNSQLQEVVEAFCQVIRMAGYIPGLYGSEYNLWAKINRNTLPKDIIKWVAHYGNMPAFDCDLWQSSDHGVVSSYNGPVDVDNVMSDRFKSMINVKSKPDTTPTIKPGMLYPSNPTVVGFQLFMNHDGCETPVDGQKTGRFYSDLEKYIDGTKGKMTGSSIVGLKLYLNYNNYYVDVNEKKTTHFINLMKEFMNDMKLC